MPATTSAAAESRPAPGVDEESRLPGSAVVRPVLAAAPWLLLCSLVIVLASRQGGFAQDTMVPAALLALLLALIVGLVHRGHGLRSLSTPALVALGLFAAYTAWSYLTVLWADAGAQAWEGSNLTLLYLLVLTVLMLGPVTPRAAWIGMLVLVVGLSSLGVVTVWRLSRSESPEDYVYFDRLSAPVGYPNATAALFVTGAWLALGLASRSWLPVAVRAVSFGGTSVLAMLALLAQSRGSLFTAPLVALGFLLLVPGRARAVLALGVVAVATAPAVPDVLDVFRAESQEQTAALAGDALGAMLVSGALAAGAGVVFAVIEGRLALPARTARVASIAVVVLALAVGVAGFASLEPWNRMPAWWDDFRTSTAVESTDTHFSGLGSHRYDFWRVGLGEFAAHPVAGIGVDNFLVPYLQERRSAEEPLYPHSLGIRLLMQTGVVGTLLFAGFVAMTCLAAVKARAGPARDVAGVAAAAAGVFVLHGLVDWLWEMPVLGVLAFALAGVALGQGRRQEERPALSRARAWAVAGVALVCVAAAGASLALPWLSSREVEAAASSWGVDPERAFARLDRAASLNPLSDEPLVIAGIIAGRLERYGVMEDWLQRAVGRVPTNWYTQLQLGVAGALTGNDARAREALDRALALNPREPVVCRTRDAYLAGREVTLESVEAVFRLGGSDLRPRTGGC